MSYPASWHQIPAKRGRSCTRHTHLPHSERRTAGHGSPARGSRYGDASHGAQCPTTDFAAGGRGRLGIAADVARRVVLALRGLEATFHRPRHAVRAVRGVSLGERVVEEERRDVGAVGSRVVPVLLLLAVGRLLGNHRHMAGTVQTPRPPPAEGRRRPVFTTPRSISTASRSSTLTGPQLRSFPGALLTTTRCERRGTASGPAFGARLCVVRSGSGRTVVGSPSRYTSEMLRTPTRWTCPSRTGVAARIRSARQACPRPARRHRSRRAGSGPSGARSWRSFRPATPGPRRHRR